MVNAVSLASSYLPPMPHVQELRRAASLGALAAAALSSIALAYYHPDRWIQAAALTVSVQALTLPALIKKAKTDWLRPLLIASMLGTTCLLSGGMMASVFKHSAALLGTLRGARFTSTVNEFMWVSSLIGYGLPACQVIFDKMKELAQFSQWSDKLRHLKTHLEQEFGNRRGYLSQMVQGSLMLAILALPNLIQHCLISLCLLLRVDSVPSLLMMEASSTSRGIERLKEIMNTLKFLNRVADFFSISLADNVREAIHSQLKTALFQIDSERDLQKAFALLQNDLIPLIPSWQTPEQMIDLFQGEFLIVLNAKIEAFIQDIESDTGARNRLILDYEVFEQELQAFEQARTNRAPRQELLTRRDQLLPKLAQLRAASEKLLMSKQVWQNFFNFFQLVEEDALLRLTNPQRLMNFFEEHAPDFLRIRTIYHSLTGEINQRFQRCINLLVNEEEAEEAVSACLFLGAERCDFKIGDYQDLQRWLNIHSMPEIEDRLNAIGLQFEEDLYINGIIPRRGLIDKQAIKTNLKAYIDRHLERERKWTTRLYKSISQLRQTTPSLNAMVERIIQFTYAVYLKGLILLPVLLHPEAAALGCAIPPLAAVVRLSPFLERLSSREDMRVFISSARLCARLNLITITSSEFNRTTFDNGNWIARTRLVYWMAVATFLLNSSFGSFLEGVEIGKNLVNRFNA
ncbi:putative membrane protein [Candidatus Protochlamydia naegleriophila]|uniref:Putative membrane protein n=1 Tax=Candidatus Protochlamydia naegleriophila TaxID=389348 RepID=A0A0U5J9B9_9BACT|nr:hypothetical protein [Candidatus Protochlamydia naegleriophila]CUI15677.1 putative membrane protein [Candidatus Protochlamydia naegleriophila]